MSSSVQWVPFSSGDALPENAIQACKKFGSDNSPLYIGKDPQGVIGKVNTQAGNTKIKNLWCHGSCWYEPFKLGSILVGNPDLVEWHPYSIGEPLPRDAFLGGNQGANKPLYVGRNAAGEVGKITVNAHSGGDGNMNNLWCHHTGKSTSGDILVIRKADPDDVPDQAKDQVTGCIGGSAHDFRFTDFCGEMIADAEAGQTAENSSSNAFGGGVGGSQSTGARTSAKKSDSTEVGGGVQYMGQGVSAHAKKDTSAEAEAEASQNVSGNANFSYNSSQDNKRADQQAAAGQVKGMYAVGAICKKCGHKVTCFPMERVGRMVPP